MYPGRATCCRATCCCVVNAACNYVSMCLSVAQKTRGLSGESVRHVLMINVSPVEYGHVLLVPQLDCCLPQVHPHILRDIHREGERCGCNLSDSVQQRLVQVLNVLSVLVAWLLSLTKQQVCRCVCCSESSDMCCTNRQTLDRHVALMPSCCITAVVSPLTLVCQCRRCPASSLYTLNCWSSLLTCLSQ